MHRPTRAPSRAAAYAASQPAWPAPIDDDVEATSFTVSLLSDAEPREDVRQHFVRRAPARDLFERRARLLQIGEHELLRQRAAVASAAARARASASRARSSSVDVPDVRDRRRSLAIDLDVERRRAICAAKLVQARRRSSPTPRTASGRVHAAPQIALVLNDDKSACRAVS